ncbi:dipeptidase [Porphyromonas pogonae]|uniref:dipeptidase n=1 Tax=Porphyromonas pogonae TaxID=867595 RepID=UPI002E7769F0|nr:C69 family dipeptidase [Porphyromonas pogonae]
MKRFFTFFLSVCVGVIQPLLAQNDDTDRPWRSPESCTSVMVGKKASVDGSVMTSHTCDSWYRTWLTMRPAKTYTKDTVEAVYEGRMHTEYPDDQTKMTEKGRIKQIRSTYKYLDTSYPCLNEKQLGIGETTIEGKTELINPKAMFMIEELQRIALERCSTARQAIKLIGELIEKHGYADYGECLTIADPKEVWQMEIFGVGKDKIGGVWAARRIPDDHIGVSANIPRIGKILKDPEYFMASANVSAAAKELGFWDGKEPFVFWKAYSKDKKAYMIREYFILNYFAPSLGLKFDDREEMPFSVKPDKPVDVTDVMAVLRQTYEGTEYDMLKNLKVEVKDKKTEKTDTITSPAANPWMTTDMVTMLNGIKKDVVKRQRTIAVPQCAYSTVIQLRSWLPDAIGGVVWFAFDNPAQSPRIPIFAGNTQLPKSFEVCGQHRFRTDAAVWSFRRANKLASVRWGRNRANIEEAVKRFTDKGVRELPWVEAEYKKILTAHGAEEATKFLNEYTADFAGAAMLRWQEMGDEYWSKYQMGF